MYTDIQEHTTQLNQAAITATGTSQTLVMDGMLGQLIFLVDVTAVSGTTPSLTIQPQVSNDGVTWYNAGSAGTALTAAGTQRFALDPVRENYARLSYTVSGTTPSFTATITALWA